jgi:hypothetical protein
MFLPKNGLGAVSIPRILPGLYRQTMRRFGIMPRALLSSQGLQRGASISAKDFAFIGHKATIECTKFQAAFISPRVHSLLQEDTTTDSLFVDCLPQEIDENRIFSLIEQLMNGCAIDPTVSEACGILRVAGFLGNIELLNQFGDDSEELTSKNVCPRMMTGEACGRSIENAISFAASHFSELSIDDLKDLDPRITERIVSAPDLRVTDEDSLLNFIRDLDCDRPILLRHVLTEYLSREGISAFLEFVSLPDLDPVIWSSLCRRLACAVPHGQSRDSADVRSRYLDPGFALRFGNPLQAGIELPMRNVGSLDGIIAYLTRKHGGNLHDKGIVTITAKSVRGDEPLHSPKNVADPTNQTWFCSENAPRQWLCWDFGEMRVRPTHYTITATDLKTWVIEGSISGNWWTEIDRRAEGQDFLELRQGSFAVRHPAEFRFLRITQTSPRRNGDNYLVVDAVEFFGTLAEPPPIDPGRTYNIADLSLFGAVD